MDWGISGLMWLHLTYIGFRRRAWIIPDPSLLYLIPILGSSHGRTQVYLQIKILGAPWKLGILA